MRRFVLFVSAAAVMLGLGALYVRLGQRGPRIVEAPATEASPEGSPAPRFIEQTSTTKTTTRESSDERAAAEAVATFATLQVAKHKLANESDLVYQTRLEVIRRYDAFMERAGLDEEQEAQVAVALYMLGKEYRRILEGRTFGPTPGPEAIRRHGNLTSAMFHAASSRAMHRVHKVLSENQYGLFYELLAPDVMSFVGKDILVPRS